MFYCLSLIPNLQHNSIIIKCNMPYHDIQLKNCVKAGNAIFFSSSYSVYSIYEKFQLHFLLSLFGPKRLALSIYKHKKTDKSNKKNIDNIHVRSERLSPQFI